MGGGGAIALDIIADLGNIATDIIGMALSSQQAKAANAFNMNMFEKQQKFDKEVLDYKKLMSNKQLGLQKEQMAFTKSEARKNRKEREEERLYQRKENQYSKVLGLVNQNKMLRDGLTNVFGFQPTIIKQSQMAGV